MQFFRCGAGLNIDDFPNEIDMRFKVPLRASAFHPNDHDGDNIRIWASITDSMSRPNSDSAVAQQLILPIPDIVLGDTGYKYGNGTLYANSIAIDSEGTTIKSGEQYISLHWELMEV